MPVNFQPLNPEDCVFVDSRIATDLRISAAAVRVAVYLLGKPEDFVITVEDISESLRFTKGRVYSIFKELINAGYLERLEIRNGRRIIGVEYFFFEDPEDRKTYKFPDPIARAVPTEGFVYVLTDPTTNLYKIGVTIDPAKRLIGLGYEYRFVTRYDVLIKSDDAYYLEQSLHRKFHAVRIHHEWFDLSPEDLSYLVSLETPESRAVRDGLSVK